MSPTLDVLTEQVLADQLGVRREAVRKWRQLGTGPAYVRVGGPISGPILYRVEDINAWLAAHVHQPAPVEGAE